MRATSTQDNAQIMLWLIVRIQKHQREGSCLVSSQFYFPASGQSLVTWSQVSPLPPPGEGLYFYRAEGSAFISNSRL